MLIFEKTEQDGGFPRKDATVIIIKNHHLQVQWEGASLKCFFLACFCLVGFFGSSESYKRSRAHRLLTLTQRILKHNMEERKELPVSPGWGFSLMASSTHLSCSSKRDVLLQAGSPCTSRRRTLLSTVLSPSTCVLPCLGRFTPPALDAHLLFIITSKQSESRVYLGVSCQVAK